ncbi:MAG: hypothetical protein CVV24_07585 [Ignavibacteriae bacterium HGW-Ignavibacteriae-3]|nr:MAG: hypothetical protein CVV24_07585 [Ignavibacteriae bacterium HGW-Ignavibacteriae-3]
MTREQFDAAFPEEFWREVVDRINVELPDTLLLAEAFWLMEGYFVRTLGMHRVYNSAFMHMMMKEENSKYRDLISNTLEFEPEILKRYVNFMSNPDEETSIKQFGTDDKYFGVCTLMVTLPGLPMFSHGQVEGYTEKYGMEYQRAYYNETPNQWLVERHQKEIFPLMNKRYLFSQVANFWLFDFVDEYGSVNENVFAYTNSELSERALVLYNNKYEDTSGIIYSSSPKLMNNYGGKGIETRKIAEVMHIRPTPRHFYIFREHISGLEFIKTGSDISKNGFYAELGAFKLRVFLDWREVYDESGEWEKLAWKLGNSGVPNMNRSFMEMKFEAVHYAFERMFDEEAIEGFIKTCVLEDEKSSEEDRISFIDEKYFALLSTVKNHFDIECDLQNSIEKFESEIVSVRKLNRLLDDEFDSKKNSVHKDLHRAVRVSRDTNYHDNSIIFMLWLIITNMKELFPAEGKINKQNYIEEMLLDSPVKKILKKMCRGDLEVLRDIYLFNIFKNDPASLAEIFRFDEKNETVNSAEEPAETDNALLAFLKNEIVLRYIGINQFEGVWYYSKENFEELFDWLFTLSSLQLMNCDHDESRAYEECFEEKLIEFNSYSEKLREIMQISEKSEYKFETLINNLSGGIINPKRRPG